MPAPTSPARWWTHRIRAAPGPGEAVVSIRASAINPADLLIFEGRYPGPESLPAPVGIEGAGFVDAVGEGVTGLAPGDHVLSLGRANWAERIRADTATLIRIPKALGLSRCGAAQGEPADREPDAVALCRSSAG